MRKISTLCLPLQKERVLLGMKKRGFGVGRWNGFGGKIEDGETIEQSAKRETLEEAKVEIASMEKVGIHEFRFASNSEDVLEVHVFRVDAFTGEPEETEEMKPQWFSLDEIPFDHMWPDDIYWFPFFLSGKKFKTSFLFGEGDRVLQKSIQEVSSV